MTSLNAQTTCAGFIKMDYLIVKPVRLLKDDAPDIFWPRLDKRVYASPFEAKPLMHIGHRGCGNSYYNRNSKNELDPNLCSSVRENCVNSFATALKIGRADMVEFDVQLTRDMTPVVYHDFVLLYKGEPSTVNKHTLTQLQTPS